MQTQSKSIREYQEKMTLTINKEFTQITVQESNNKTVIYDLSKESTIKLKFLNFIYPTLEKLEQDLLDWYLSDINIETGMIDTLYSLIRDFKPHPIVTAIYNENKSIGQLRIGE